MKMSIWTIVIWKELDIILMGLFFQNVDKSANPIIEQFMQKSATEDVLF